MKMVCPLRQRIVTIALLLGGCGRPISLGSIGSMAGTSDMATVQNRCPVTVLAAAPFPAQYGTLTSDDTNLYWVELDNSATPTPGEWIMSISKNGGTPSRLGAGGEVTSALAVDNANVYFAAYGIGILHGSIGKVPKAGGVKSELLSGQQVSGLAINSSGIFIVGFTGQSTTSYALQYLPFGGALSPIASGDSGPSQGGAIALDSQNIYWVTGMTLTKVPLANPAGAIHLATGMLHTDFQSIAVDGTNAYYVDGTSLTKVPLSGGTASKLAVTQPPVSIVVTATAIYWRNGPTRTPGDPGALNQDASIMMLPSDGSSGPRTIVSGLHGGGVLAVDATSVYFVDDNKLNRICATAATHSDGGQGG